MKGYTSRERFDESRRFVAVNEEMGRARLDADANEQARLQLTDTRRRSADLADGSPDDGFLVTDSFVVDAITGTAGWTGSGLAPGDLREIPPELRLERRDPETLPHVLRTRGNVDVLRTLARPVDLLAMPDRQGAAWSAAELDVRVRIARVASDDEVAMTRLMVRDEDEVWHEVLEVPAEHRDGVLRVPIARLAPLRRGGGASRRAVLTGWGLNGLPPRADTDLDTLVAVDAELGADLVLRGGGGTPGTAGRLYRDGRRAFIETDWRYSRQPYLPDPAPVTQPDAGRTVRHVVELDVWDREVHQWQDRFLAEPALDGDATTFRRQQVVQVRLREIDPPAVPAVPLPELPTPTSAGLLSSHVPDGVLPDRHPPEEPDRCRDRCLSTEQVTTAMGYLGTVNAHVRIEVLAVAGTDDRVLLWSRDNASLAAQLTADLPADGLTVSVGSFEAARFRAGDLVTLEDEAARLDPGDPRHPPVLRRLRAVDTATGRLELEPDGYHLTEDPAPLLAGGGPGRVLRTEDVAAVRRWDGADWLVTGVRYRLVDNITFAVSGSGFRPGEYWQLTARVVAPDGAAQGLVERRVDAPPDGPHHTWARLGLVVSTREAAGAPVQRTFTDLRERFLPLREVRDRLIELGARQLAPGAFTVVVGDGDRTFGHIDQDLAEGVTGDEAVHAALAELAGRPGTIYLRAGRYVLEHPVVLQQVSGVRILGDGPATRLEVRGAGGAFVLDRCGGSAPVVVEQLDLVELPAADVPIGNEPLDGAGLVGDLVALDDGGGALTRADVLHPSTGLAGVLDTMRERVSALRPFEGRAAASMVATVLELRRLQRTHPGQTLEDVAPDQLATLRRLPHGVLTVSDSRDVRLSRLRVESTERSGSGATAGAGILLTGSLTEVEVSGCAVLAGNGLVATALARALSVTALALRPRAGLSIVGLRVVGNDLRARADGTGVGVLVTDGDLEGVLVQDNDIAGFATGVRLQDRAETRHAESVERTTVSDNRLVAIAEVGIDALADVVDVRDDEIRLARAAAPLRAGVRVAGSHVRVSGCVIDLPDDDPEQSLLALTAGVVVGGGVDDGLLDPVVTDVAVTDTRVTGSGPGTTAHGVVVGGAAPVLDVTVRRCDLRSLGGSGVRGFGHAAPVGGLRVQDCTVEDVATAELAWSAAVAAAVQALVPAATGNAPRTVLESLLGASGDGVRAALDGLLRWIEQATLRCGVGLSVVDDAVVAQNRVRGVGRPGLPAQVSGTDVHVVGVAVLGGEAHRVEDNDVREVHGAVRRLAPVPLPRPVGPDLVGFLDRLPTLSTHAAGDLYEAVVGLRGLALDYAVARGADRGRLGRRIYAAMEAVSTALAERGGQAARIGARLDEAVEVMREAQGDADHTAAATLVRVASSHAAELAAPDDAAALAWRYAGQVDGAAVAGREALVATVDDVVGASATLLDGLALDRDLDGHARAVVAAPAGSAAEQEAILTLAEDLGAVATARRLVPAATGRTLTPSQSKLLASVLGAVSSELDRPITGDVTPDVVAGLADGIDALVTVLGPLKETLATTVRQSYERVRRSAVSPRPVDVTALRDALAEVQTFLADPAAGVPVGEPEVDAARTAAHGQLVMLTAGWVDRQLAGLADRDEAAETRSLTLLSGAVTQLGQLAGDDPAVASHVDELRRAVKAAADEPRDRAKHKAAAARSLALLRSEQAKVVNAAPPVDGAPETTDVNDRLAGLTQLTLGLLTGAEPADERRVGALGTHLREAIATEVDLPDGERRRLLEKAATGVAGVTGSASRRAAALHEVGSVLADLSGAAAEQSASQTGDAVATFAATLPLLTDPQRQDAERLASARSLLAAGAHALSPSSASALASAASLPALLDRLSGDLSVLTVPRPTPEPVAPPEVVQPMPADGVATAVRGTVAVVQNRVHGARRGIVVGGPDLHPLAPLAPLDGDGDVACEVEVVRNTVRGAVVTGLTVDPPGAGNVRVEGNDLAGCAGAATPEPEAPGRAVLEVRGRGRLSLRSNRLDGNGSSEHPGVIHAIAVRFDGDVDATANEVRHTGGRLGGAGLLVVQAPLPSAAAEGLTWDFTELCTRPFLVADPPPAPPRPVSPPGLRPLNPDLSALLGPVRSRTVSMSAATGLAGTAGGSVLPGVAAATLASVRPPALALLTRPAAPPPPPVAAAIFASRWLTLPAAPAVVARPMAVANLRPVLDFLLRPPLVLLPAPPRPTRVSLQLGDNTVHAEGPALLALGSARVLLGVTVTGNTLVSSGSTGAVYLRDVDSCVVGSNRMESAGAVTVVVVRARDALVAVSGNVLAGREPPLSPTLRPRPELVAVEPERPQVRLDLDLSQELGGSLSVELDPASLLAALRTKQDTTAATAAEEAAASFDVFARRNKIVTDPRAALVLETASKNRLLDVDLSDVLVKARLESLRGVDVSLPAAMRRAGDRLAAGAAAVDAGHHDAAELVVDAANQPVDPPPAEPPTEQPAEPGAGTPGGDLGVQVTRLTEDFSRILSDGGLSPAARLFGVAKSSGLPDTAARSLVAEHLVRSSGDGEAALRSGLGVLTGVSGPAPAPQPGRRAGLPALEAVLGSVVDKAAERLVPSGPGRVPGTGGAVPLHPTLPLLPTLPTLPGIGRPTQPGPWRPTPPTLPGTTPPIRPTLPPPRPTQHTLVVIGGAQVALSGNATTAGADVRPAEATT